MAREEQTQKHEESARTLAKEKVIEAISTGLRVSSAAKAAGISRTTIYNWKDSDPDFKKRYDEAFEASTERLEEAAYDLALRGSERPIVAGGEVIDHFKVPEPRMLEFMLKSRKPNTYGDRKHVTLDGQLSTTHLSDEEIDAKITELQAKTTAKTISDVAE